MADAGGSTSQARPKPSYRALTVTPLASTPMAGTPNAGE
jgi:hypothetical protein